MKKAALFGSLLLISFASASQIIHEWATTGMKGHVKSTEEKLYVPTEKNPMELWTVTTRNYNMNGKIADERVHDVQFRSGHITTYQYDSKGQLKSYDYRLTPSGTLYNTSLCTHDANGKQMKITEIDEDGKIWRTEIRKYNSSGKEIERSCSYTGGGKPEKTKFIYNAKGVKIEERRDFMDGADGTTKPEKEEFISDSTGNLIQVNGFCNIGFNVLSKWTYLSFDEKGNWTKCVYIDKTADTSVDLNTLTSHREITIIRKIEYY